MFEVAKAHDLLEAIPLRRKLHQPEYKRTESLSSIVYTEFMFVLGRVLQVIMDIRWLNNHILEKMSCGENEPSVASNDA
jgi:hypothetical protein